MDPLGLEVLLELVLRTLFSRPAGEWRRLQDLEPTGALAAECRGRSKELGQKVLEGLRLTWLAHPDEPADSALCLILFFYDRDERMWHPMAVFNRETL